MIFPSLGLLLTLILFSALPHGARLTDVIAEAQIAPADAPANPAETQVSQANPDTNQNEQPPLRQSEPLPVSPPSPPLSLRALALAAKQRLQANEIKRKLEYVKGMLFYRKVF